MKKGHNACYKKGTGLTLTVGWENSELIPEGFILKVLLAGETFNFFLLDEPKLIGENLSSQ